jgi:hypothetical protein
MIDGVARSPHPPLRHRRDRQRELALQEPRLAFPRSPRLRNPDQLRRGQRYRLPAVTWGLFWVKI